MTVALQSFIWLNKSNTLVEPIQDHDEVVLADFLTMSVLGHIVTGLEFGSDSHQFYALDFVSQVQNIYFVLKMNGFELFTFYMDSMHPTSVSTLPNLIKSYLVISVSF
jgi:hypothetical protein